MANKKHEVGDRVESFNILAMAYGKVIRVTATYPEGTPLRGDTQDFVEEAVSLFKAKSGRAAADFSKTGEILLIHPSNTQ